MADEKYNGWTNYETWLANVWIDNSPSEQEMWQEEALLAVTETAGESCPDGAAIRRLAGSMREAIEDAASEHRLEGLLSDLLNAAISSVNWDELARHYINDAKEAVQ